MQAKFVRSLAGLFLCALLVLVPDAMAQRATLQGRIVDATDNSPLPGANVIAALDGVADATTGTSADVQGRFQIPNLRPGAYTITVRYVGYQSTTVQVNLGSGENRTVEISLQAGNVDLNTVVVSASRAAEQVLDAPASVTVMGPQEILQTVAPSSVQTIRNELGVDMAQTGVDRFEVVLRGFNNAFSGATYTMVDYRLAAAPSLGVNVHSIMPNPAIDLEKVEIVRGPGSALYGAGVDAGVIHFITKDPFSYPGMSVAVTGGQRSLLGVEARAATTFGERLGVKINANVAQANDWALDPNDPLDQAQLNQDFIYSNPASAFSHQKVDPTTGRLLRDYDYFKYTLSGLAQYRFRPGTTLSVNVGQAALTGIVLSGIGTLQANNFGYSYGQIRLQHGNFFTQVYLNQNDAGKSYVYGSNQQVVDNGRLLRAQAQYDVPFSSDSRRLIFGVDYASTRPDTEGTIIGRNEGNTIDVYGGYAQATLGLVRGLDFTVALRGDYDNISEEFQVSPRAALVYRTPLGNALRVTYNRAYSSPGTNSLFLDIPGQVTNFPGGYQFIVQARGAAEGFTFNNFRSNNAAQLFLPIPGVFGGSFNYRALPLLAPYAAAASGVAPALIAGSINLPGISAQQRTLLGQLMGYTAQNAATVVGLAAATTAGRLGIPDGSAAGYRTVDGPVDIPRLTQTTTQTFEVGYKSIFAQRLLLAADVYYTEKNNFIGPLQVESPLVYLGTQQFTVDVATRVGQILATSNDPNVQGLRQALLASGLTDAQIAGIFGQLMAGALARTPVAAVQPDQSVLANATAQQVAGFLSYRNFGRVRYWGADVSAQYLVSSRLNIHGNVSFVSDNFFDNEELDEANTSLAVALNAPALKAKAGFSYNIPRGASFNASVRYSDGFPVRSGPYVGDVDAFTMVDLGVGYDLARVARGLRLDVTVNNLLNDERREFVGAPKIGRQGLFRLTYTM